MPSKFRSMARHDSTAPLRTMKMSGRPSLLASIFSVAPAVSQASCVIFVSRRVTPPELAPPPAAAPPPQPAVSNSAQARAAQLLDTSVFFIAIFPGRRLARRAVRTVLLCPASLVQRPLLPLLTGPASSIAGLFIE